MKYYNRILAFCASALLALAAGCDKYDDSELWNDIDKAYNDLTQIKPMVEAISQQVEMVSAVIEGGAITNITAAEDGGYTISYKDAFNIEQTITVASKEDVSTKSVLGTKEENGVLYWTIDGEFLKDLDGAKVEVAGRIPSFDVNKEGYWTMNGALLKKADGSAIKAEGKSISVITKVEKTSEGKGLITLGDGSTLTVELFDAFSIGVFDGETELLKQHLIVMPASRTLTLSYTLTGPSAGETIVKITRLNGLTAVLNTDSKTINVTFPAGFEEGGFQMIIADAEGNVLIKPIYIGDRAAIPDYYGIKTVEDLQKFVLAVNGGASLKRFRDGSGAVVLLNDIDLTGVTSWTPVGTESKPFVEEFDGKGFTLKGISFETDVTAQKYTGIFGVVDGGSIKNLNIGQDGEKWTIKGTATNGTAVAPVVALAKGGAVIANCTNNLDIDFQGTNEADQLLMLSGIVARSEGASIGTEGAGCVNNGDIVITQITNQKNGLTGVNMGGICAVSIAEAETNITACTNNGHLACPTGRAGGIGGSFLAGKMTGCTNAGLVEDGTQYQSAEQAYNYKRMGGLAGATGEGTTIESCTNLGTVLTHVGCRCGGFVGHNAKGIIKNCTNGDEDDISKGNIIGTQIKDASNNTHGPGWACGYTNTALKGCYGYGRMATYAQKDNLEADDVDIALHDNAIAHGTSNYDMEQNWVDWTHRKYYSWDVVEEKTLVDGVTYKAVEWNRGIDRKMKIVEIDLTKENIEITTGIADDCMPNPSPNKSESNGGDNGRELLSEICKRKYTEDGQNIIVGMNSGFFDTYEGILRGIHVQEGIPMYVNNQITRYSLVNHQWGVTQFTDKTFSCGVKDFKGYYKVAGTEYEYYSINDTICRHGHDALKSNAYTSLYKKKPSANRTNALAKNALYVVAEFTGDVMKVNTGYATAKVTAIKDGLSSALSSDELPYLTEENQIALQIRGDVATAVKAALKVGDNIEIKCDIKIDAVAKPIYTLNSSMYQFLVDGADRSTNGISTDNSNLNVFDPVSFIGTDKNATKVWFVQVDGRDDGVSLGMKSPEMAHTIKYLGGYNMTRLDGGGSSAMWIGSKGNGKIVSNPSDSKGERSCMSYIMVRVK